MLLHGLLHRLLHGLRVDWNNGPGLVDNGHYAASGVAQLVQAGQLWHLSLLLVALLLITLLVALLLVILWITLLIGLLSRW